MFIFTMNNLSIFALFMYFNFVNCQAFSPRVLYIFTLLIMNLAGTSPDALFALRRRSSGSKRIL